MKKSTVNSFSLFIPSSLCLVGALMANNAQAATSLYFDVNGTSAGSGVVNGGTYAWDGTDWDASSGLAGAATAWVATDFARFTTASVAGYTVTVNADENMAGLYETQTGVALNINDAGNGTGALDVTTTGGTVISDPHGNVIGNVQGFLITGSSININANITGSGGVDQQLAGSLSLFGNNTYSGGTEVTGGQNTYFNNNSSFGTGVIYVHGGGQALINSSGAAVNLANAMTFATVGQNIILANTAGGSTVFTGVLSLLIGANGVNNEFTGNSIGSVQLDGTLNLDLSGADDTLGNQWQIIDTSSLDATYGTDFSVNGFTSRGGGLWAEGNYIYDQNDGTLAVVPEPSAAALGLLGGLSTLGMMWNRRRKA